MNTKNVTDTTERKKLKRTARKKAAPKAKRAAGVARGSAEEEDPAPGSGPAQALSQSNTQGAATVSIFRTKSIDALIAASEDPEKKLRRTLGPWSLTALGIGAVIGSGIFTLTGTAAAGETLSYKSILHAPVLDLLMHGTKALSHDGAAGRRSGDHVFRFC